jgi:cytoskeleton protein RodZ
LPGGIFNKGFVRAYARHIGIDEDQTVAEYLEASGENLPPKPELPQEESVPAIEAKAEPPSTQLPWGVFAAILLLVALVLSVWSHRQKKHEGTVAQPSVPPTSQQSHEDHPLPSESQPERSVSALNDQTAGTPVPIRSTVSTAAQVTPASAPVGSPAILKPAAQASAPLTPGEFVVLVQAHEASWTAITSDGRSVYSGIMPAGDQHAVRGRREVVVKSGNVGGIDLEFNGKRLEPQGHNGQVRTITFGPAGLLSSSAPASPAP